MASPKNFKEVQQLNGRITVLTRFISKAVHQSLPLYQILKKGRVKFEWNAECEDAFQSLKKTLAKLPILVKPILGEVLFMYISISDKTLVTVLVKEIAEGQRPVYFVSKVLQGVELCYQKVEKATLALVVTARKVKHYFQFHKIIVRTNIPLKVILYKPDLAGRMITWAVELSGYEIDYEPRVAIKAQVLADFIVEMIDEPNHSQ